MRDELLGIDHGADFDLVLQGSSAELARFLFERRVSRIPPVTYERFGTAMVQVSEAQVEIVTARRESYDAGSRKPLVQPATLEEDAFRRDFTVNTLMRNLHTQELLDPLGNGMQDLKARVLRTPLEPEATFHDDPLRMLRAVRFRWKLGFLPAPGLYEAIRREAHRLEIISKERIHDEFAKMLLQPTAADALQDLMNLHLLHQFAPELVALVGIDQGEYHHLDAWEHTLLVVRGVPPGDLVLTLAALLHDVGKSQTRTVDENGRTRFFGHETVGAKIAARLLRRLKFSNDEVEQVAALVRSHMRLNTGQPFTPTAGRRLVRDLGPLVPRLLDLAGADANAHHPEKRRDVSPARAVVESVMAHTPEEVLDSPLEGKEIMELLQIEPGPEVGRWKRYLAEKVIEGELAPLDKTAARDMLLAAVAQSRAQGGS